MLERREIIKSAAEYRNEQSHIIFHDSDFYEACQFFDKRVQSVDNGEDRSMRN